MNCALCTEEGFNAATPAEQRQFIHDCLVSHGMHPSPALIAEVVRQMTPVTVWAKRSIGMGSLGDDLSESDWSPPPDDGGFFCDWSDCGNFFQGGGGGGGELPTGGGSDWWNLWYGTPYASDIPNDFPNVGTVLTIGSDSPDPGFDFWGNDPGGGFWNWFNSNFTNTGNGMQPPSLPDYIPGNWNPSSIPPLAGPTHIGVCPPGFYHPLPSEGDVTSCVPFPPNTSEARKQQLTQQGNQAAQQAQQRSGQQQQQSQLQQMAAACAAQGGRLVQVNGQYQCQRADGSLQSLSGIPFWVWLIVGALVLTR